MRLLNFLNFYLGVTYNDLVPYCTSSLYRKSGTYCLQNNFTLEKAKAAKKLLGSKGYKVAILKKGEHYRVNLSRVKKHLKISVDHILFYHKDAKIIEMD